MAKRRRFLALLSGTVASTMVLAGCLGNPPSSTNTAGSGSSTGPATTPAAAPAANADLEVKTISLGFVPILEAAPLVVGVEKGFFAKHGLEEIGRAHV